MLDTTIEPLDASTVDWRGLRAEAARRLDRATKKIAKKSAKAKTLGGESAEALEKKEAERDRLRELCLLYTSPSPRDTERSRMPSSA